MLHFSNVITAIDSHTAGEPTRILTGGLPKVSGATMMQRRQTLERDFDHLRRGLIFEPRGHDAIVLAFLLPPCDPDADLGVVFANDAGYLGMCGHGAIGVATIAVATGLVATHGPDTPVVLDTPAGTVRCQVHVQNDRPVAVTITNVPSFMTRQRAMVELPHFGKVAVDVAYGGNWFGFVEASQLGLEVERESLAELMAAATEVRQALIDAGVRGVHPDSGEGEIIDHIKLFRELAPDATDGRPGARALTLCPGKAYDRSPCGTGTSAKMAVLHAKGELASDQWFVSESVLGTRFEARFRKEQQVGKHTAIVPEVRGSAWITGMQTFVFDPEDPCVFGL